MFMKLLCRASGLISTKNYAEGKIVLCVETYRFLENYTELP